MKKPFYVTTPIYYVNDVPHLGTAYCTVAADVAARCARLLGRDVLFLTGTDEHGEKVQQSAEAKGKTPQAYTDEVAALFEGAWRKLNISFDDFIRTTQDRHKQVVQKYIKASVEKGDIYLGEYEGWYCVPDETFWTEAQLVNGKCPTCGRDVKKIKEQNYFFKISKYTDRLLKHIDDHPDFILPEGKRNEVVAFLKEGVRDVSVSRTSFTWGIPFPEATPSAQKHVIYVWFDALINYISALEPQKSEDKLKKYWPEAVHLIGKDILRFHAVYWPCFLMSVGLPLPKHIFAHGWWTVEGKKMSKSLGNVIEPLSFAEQYGLDALRLFMFREFPMGQDGDFSLKNFKERTNADLANNLGNLVSRTLNLIDKNLGGQFTAPKGAPTTELVAVTEAISESQRLYLQTSAMQQFDYHHPLVSHFNILHQLNKYIDVKAPWSLAKDPAKKQELAEVLNNVVEGLRISCLFLWPFIPQTCEEILKRIGQRAPSEYVTGAGKFADDIKWGQGADSKVVLGPPIFMRLQ